jgi:4-amino-4-deoxy-L-arabinose transferase-like glycosyltransferase
VAAFPTVLVPLVAFVVGVVLLGALATTGFVYFDNDALYADVARTMVEGGDWLNPQIHGVPFLDKPPLFYWVLALFMSVAGEAVGVLRAPAVLAGALSLACVAWAGQRGRGKLLPAVLGVAMVLAVPLFVGYCRRVYMEVPVALCVVVGIVAYERALGGARRHYLLGGAAVGCGFMIKSLVGLFGLIPFVIMVLVGRRWEVLRDRWFWLGIGLAALLVVPWHFYQLAGNTDVFLEFTWQLHVEKQILEAQPWSAGPPWFYLKALVVDAPVLGLCVAAGVVDVVVRLVRRRAVSALDLHLFVALLVMLGVFSVSETKKLLYLVVVVPPAAILAARSVAARMPKPVYGWAIVAVLGVLALRAAPLYEPDGQFLQGDGTQRQMEVSRAAGRAAAPGETVYVLDNYFSAVQFVSRHRAVSYWRDTALVQKTQRIPYVERGGNMRAVPTSGAVSLLVRDTPGLWVVRRSAYDKMHSSLPLPIHRDEAFVLLRTGAP